MSKFNPDLPVTQSDAMHYFPTFNPPDASYYLRGYPAQTTDADIMPQSQSGAGRQDNLSFLAGFAGVAPQLS